MTRRNLRWAVFCLLVMMTIGLAAYSSWSNHNLIKRLLSANSDTTANALGDLFDRQDKVNRFQSLPTPQRVQIAKKIRDWDDVRALHLSLSFIKDPSEDVRITLIEGIAHLIRRMSPSESVELFKSSGVHEQAAVLDAIESAGEPGLRTAQIAFESEGSRALAAKCLVRIGPKSVVFLTKKILEGDTPVSLMAADALYQIGIIKLPHNCSERLWSIYASLDSPEEKNKFFHIIATYPSKKATSILVTTLSDPAAPPHFRIASAKGLAQLNQFHVLQNALNDPDPDLVKTIEAVLHEVKEKSERNLLILAENE